MKFTHVSSLAVIAALANTPAAIANDQHKDSDTLEELVVTVARTGKSASALPNTITLINTKALENQLAINSDLFAVLGKLVPGISPSRQKLSGFGENFRGREPLYLIDGVPQSNPIRNGARASYTLDPLMIERVEVIHGANAIQGLGATGGIINYVTREASDSGNLEQRVAVKLTAGDDFGSEAMGYKGFYSIGQKKDKFDYYFAGSYHKRGLHYDGRGDIVGLHASQGDIMDSDQWNLYGKLGYEISDTRKIELFVNRYNVRATDNYIVVPGDVAEEIPTSAEKGQYPGTPPTNKVLTSSLSYEDNDVAGGKLLVKLYYQDFSATYGGDTWAGLQDPAIAPIGTIFDETRVKSRKLGFRTTYIAENLAGTGVDLTTGIDWLNDKAVQDLVRTDRTWMPEVNFYNIAPFLQLEKELIQGVRLSGGVRLENAKLSVDDYQTLAGNTRNDPDNPWAVLDVEGGSLSFTDAMLNAGLVFDLSEDFTVFTSYSQGFGMADVGRVLRSVRTPGVRVDGLVDLEPVVTDNYEAGIAFTNDYFTAKASYFISKSKLGSRLVPNTDGSFDQLREKTRVNGFEVSVDGELTETVSAGISYANIEGRIDTNSDGTLDSDLNAINISPDTINMYVSADFENGFSSRVQYSHYFDRDFPSGRNFDGYGLIDLTLSYNSNAGQFSLGVENLLDKYYLTYNAQTYLYARANTYFAGRGRVVSLNYILDF